MLLSTMASYAGSNTTNDLDKTIDDHLKCYYHVLSYVDDFDNDKKPLNEKYFPDKEDLTLYYRGAIQIIFEELPSYLKENKYSTVLYYDKLTKYKDKFVYNEKNNDICFELFNGL